MYDKYVKDIMNLYDKEQDECDALEAKGLSDEEFEKEDDKLHEKYDKLILDLNKKYNIIFRYDLADAWGMQISTLIVTSDKKDNVVCIYDNEGLEMQVEENYDKAYFTTDSSKILKILTKYEDKIKKLNEMEDKKTMYIMDGVSNSFYFDINGKIYTYEVHNLLARYDDVREQADLLSDLLTEIRESLVKDVKNIDKCLILE